MRWTPDYIFCGWNYPSRVGMIPSNSCYRFVIKSDRNFFAIHRIRLTMNVKSHKTFKIVSGRGIKGYPYHGLGLSQKAAQSEASMSSSHLPCTLIRISRWNAFVPFQISIPLSNIWNVGSPIPGLRRMHTIYLPFEHWCARPSTGMISSNLSRVCTIPFVFLFLEPWHRSTISDIDVPFGIFLVTIRISTMTNETDDAVYPISSIFGIEQIRTPIFGIIIRYY